MFSVSVPGAEKFLWPPLMKAPGTMLETAVGGVDPTGTPLRPAEVASRIVSASFRWNTAWKPSPAVKVLAPLELSGAPDFPQ